MDAKALFTAASQRDKRPRHSPDLATLIGLTCGLVLVSMAIAAGGSLRAFANPSALLIVFGGTLSIVTITSSIADVTAAFRMVGRTMLSVSRDPTSAARQMLEFAELARRHGVLALQGAVDGVSGQPFLHKCMAMVIDGAPTHDIEEVMARELGATRQRHRRSAGVLRRAAEYAPAMGLIGTLIGLVQMLGSLDDPAAIGPSMAVALLTTFYGAVLANMVLSPLAAKLERQSEDEALVNHIYLLAAASIGYQENPRRLELRLNSILPPAQRVRFYD